MVELLGGGGGDFGGVFQSLAELKRSAETIRVVLTALPSVYKEYLEGSYRALEDPRSRADFYGQRDAQICQV